MRLLLLNSTALVLFGCASGRSRPADLDLLVAPLPACYHLRFDRETRPETDLGLLPDTITLTRPFSNDREEAEGYVYAGMLPDSALPRSRSGARSFGRQVISWWIGTRDSLILSAPGQLRAVSMHLGSKLQGLWHEKHDLGERRTGTVQASRIPCPDS